MAAQSAQLKFARKDCLWVAAAPYHVLQQTLKDLDTAWWVWLKGGHGKPRFRALKRAARNWWAPSYQFPDRSQFTVQRTSKRWGQVRLPKIGLVRFRWDCDLPDGAAITNVTLKRDRVGDWTVVFALDALDAPDAPDVEVDLRNTSITCNRCQHVASESRENQAQCWCVACGHEDHADINAARNILARAAPASQVRKRSDGRQPFAACGDLRLLGGTSKQEPSGERSRAAA